MGESVVRLVNADGQVVEVTTEAVELVKVVVYDPKREAVLTFGWERGKDED